MFAACVAVHHHADRGLVLRAARADRRRTRLAPREECTRAVPVSTTARPASAPRSNCAGWRFCWSSACRERHRLHLAQHPTTTTGDGPIELCGSSRPAQIIPLRTWPTDGSCADRSSAAVAGP